MIPILFNGIDLSGYFRIMDIRGRGLIQRQINGIYVPGMEGEHLESIDVPSRNLEVDIRITNPNLRAAIDELNGILATDEPVPIVFPDEPDKTYYGTVESGSENGERVHLNRHDATIVIRRSDPNKYGPEKEERIENDVQTVRNLGTASADPIFELTALEKTTFVMVSNHDEEYNLIGRPVEEDDGGEVAVEQRVSVLKEDGTTLDTWSTTGIDVDSNYIDIAGAMTSDGSGIRADGYGTGNKMHGPAVVKELPRALEDFEIVTNFDIISRRPEENWRMEVYFHDENMNMLGKLGLKDNNRSYLRRFGLGRVGPYRGSGLENGYAIGGQNYKRDITQEATIMHLWVKREGNVYTFYIARWASQRHSWIVKETYVDAAREFSGRLKYITLFIGSYKDRPAPARLRINNVEVFEHVKVTEDQTPYILDAGDVVIFDHKEGSILVNGEPRNDLKNFGGTFFPLYKGDNQIIITPPGAFETTVRYREKYK